MKLITSPCRVRFVLDGAVIRLFYYKIYTKQPTGARNLALISVVLGPEADTSWFLFRTHGTDARDPGVRGRASNAQSIVRLEHKEFAHEIDRFD